MLVDKFGRQITYARIGITDRCNLRCFYCMPAEGIDYIPKKELLSYEELHRLISLLAQHGVNKIRITGGEPFVRKELIGFIKTLKTIDQLHQINITTNGVLLAPHLDELKGLGINSINLSIDSLNKERFKQITRRDVFDQVWSSFHKILKMDIPLKLNVVVMKGQNEEDIIPMAELTKTYPISVRFIEEMPFNGTGSEHDHISFKSILQRLREHFGEVQKIEDPPNSTSYHYKLANSIGNIGLIAAHSRTFCGTCNRIRVTAQGQLQNCLYDGGGLDLKGLLRSGKDDIEVIDAIKEAILTKNKDGFEAEKNRNQTVFESMSTIGG